MRVPSLLRDLLRVVGAVGAVVLTLWGAALAADAVLFHGFPMICGDGHPATTRRSATSRGRRACPTCS